ncbi:MAG: hypothetical protein Q4C77_19595 [Eubacteriales bacterium]|nr:hypothetical protein [Eubacteriales bacterium]
MEILLRINNYLGNFDNIIGVIVGIIGLLTAGVGIKMIQSWTT